MKKLFLTASAILAGFFIANSASAQKPDSSVIKNEEIIILRNGDKNDKTIIELKGENIKVDGQPLEAYNGNVVIRRRKGMIANSDNFNKRPNFSPDAFTNKSRTFLGVLTEKTEKGSLIKSVTKGSAAEKAGLKENDIITKLGDKQINSPEELAEVVQSFKPGDEVVVSYLRDNKMKTTKVVLGKSDDFGTAFMFPADTAMNFEFNMADIPEMKGFGNRFFKSFGAPKPRMGAEIQDTENGKGVKIINVDKDSPADKAGLKQNDVIIEMNGESVNNIEEVRSELTKSNNGETYKLKLKRDNKEMNIDVMMPKKLEKMKM